MGHGDRGQRPNPSMSESDRNRGQSPNEIKSIDCQSTEIHRVEPEKFADLVVRHGRARFIGDAAGEWLEAGKIVEVRA